MALLTYAGDPDNYPAEIRYVPDGAPADEADTAPSAFDLADRTANLDARATSLDARITSDEAAIAVFEQTLMLKNWNPQGAGPATGGAAIDAACRSSSDHSWWFCGGSSASGKAWRSTDGAVSWTDMAMPTTGISGAVLDICADASGNVQVIFNGVSNNQTNFWNGSAWVTGVANIPTPGGNVWRTHFFKGKFVTIGGSGTIAGCYVDPAAPTVATATPAPSSPPGTIGNVGVSRCYLANNFLFYCPLQQTGGWPFMAKIDDPTTNAGWTYPSIAITTSEGITGLDYSTTDSKYMAAVANTAGGSTIPLTGSTRFFTSTDGTTWTVAAGTIPECVCGLVAMTGFWVAYTTTGKIYYSTDVGATWTWSELAVGVFALAETLSARLLKTAGAEQLSGALAECIGARAPQFTEGDVMVGEFPKPKLTFHISDGDLVFMRDCARSFALLEQSLRERAIAGGFDDVEGRVRKAMGLLLRFARASSDEIVGARAHWLDADHTLEPTAGDRLQARWLKTRTSEEQK